MSYEDIRPFNDIEASEALHAVASHPLTRHFSKYLFPDKPKDYLSSRVAKVTGVDDFQANVMVDVVESIERLTTDGISYEGVENLEKVRGGKFIAMTNHRDIVLDPAFIQVMMYRNNLPFTNICIGDNLLDNDLVIAAMRSNRMIKVRRGLTPRELFEASRELSSYIREGDDAPVWVAQRQGRTKNGIDLTERSLVKMLDESGSGDFAADYDALHIIPMSISYEYESCDILKAREVLISRRGKYIKAPGEDMKSILTGIRQQKGHVNIAVCEPISLEELTEMAKSPVRNERYEMLTAAIDKRIQGAFKLWPNNYIAWDILHHTTLLADHYSIEEKERFKEYMECQIFSVLGNPDSQVAFYYEEELQEIFLGIYANPCNTLARELSGRL
ncbi:MAG: 1-acyl-sn-glycerol-3-phosphate acyltransferase [Bacteroidales bacterium]|nr:1-acyl-sn-glycerol-3-phosphate acyltransferase [Bacteroidales bacterium]